MHFIDQIKEHGINSCSSSVEQIIDWETYRYQTVMVDGEPDIIDVGTDVKYKAKIPVITFLEWLDYILYLNHNDYTYKHFYSSKIEPLKYTEESSGVWFYFENSSNNLLYNKLTDKQVISLYYIEEFEKYAVIRIANGKDVFITN